MNEMPNDILSLILNPFRKNEESLFVSLVCKRWHATINHDLQMPPRRVVDHYVKHGTLLSLQKIRSLVRCASSLLLADNRNPEHFFVGSLFSTPDEDILNWALVSLRSIPQISSSTLLELFGSLSMAGRLHILQSWEIDPSYHKAITNIAAEYGHSHILQWALENDFDMCEVCESAAKSGHLNIIKWASSNGCECSYLTSAYAAKGGYLEIIQWLRANGYDWDEKTCDFAAKYGHLEVLQWAVANGCPWDETTCEKAAEGGHLKILQWARANGCPWDGWTCTVAVIGGHLEVLKWAVENGCPWRKEDCIESAQYRGYSEIIEWSNST